MRLFEQLSSFESLLTAFNWAKKGHSEQTYLMQFEFNLEYELGRLEWELCSNYYKPSPYHHFTVHYPKTRAIAAPAFRDRVVQQSLIKHIEPVFEKSFIFDSYACRKHKGTHFGAKRVKKFLQAVNTLYPQQDVYALQTDIQGFFASMSWPILQEIITKKIDDKQTLKLISQFITHHLVAVKSTQTQLEIIKAVNPQLKQGLPIGNLTSQLLANVYLNQLDQFIKHNLKLRWYARYMDDFLIIHPSKTKLQTLKKQITQFLKQELKLSLHPKKTVIFPVKNGVPFVGYRIFHDHVLIRSNSLLRMQRRLKQRRQQLAQGEIDLSKFDQSISAFQGHLQHADTYWLQKSLFTKKDSP